MRIPNFRLKNILLAFFFIILASYSFYQARTLILGPQILVISPIDREIVPTQDVTVSGRTTNAAWLSLNGRQIFTNENGFWEETLLVPEGLSIITIDARDRFGRKEQERIRIIYN